MCGIAGGMVKHGGTGLPADGRLLAELPDDTGDAHFVPAPCQVACPVGHWLVPVRYIDMK